MEIEVILTKEARFRKTNTAFTLICGIWTGMCRVHREGTLREEAVESVCRESRVWTPAAEEQRAGRAAKEEEDQEQSLMAHRERHNKNHRFVH